MKHLLALLLLTTSASAEPLVIAAGKPTGGYDKAAQRLSQRLSQRNVDAAVLNFNGSDEITIKLCAKQADLGYTQIDAIYTRAIEGCHLTPVGFFGNEYAIIMFPPDSPHDELEDLTSENTLLVDTVGSGTDLFWTTIKNIEAEHGNGSSWAEAASLNEVLDIAPTLAEIGEIDAVLMVRKPESHDIDYLLNLGWSLGWVYDKDINDVEFNGQPLYESADNYQFYEVRSYIAAGPNFDKTLTRQIQGALK